MNTALFAAAAAFVLVALVPGAAASQASDISAATRNQANTVPHKAKVKSAARPRAKRTQSPQPPAVRASGRPSFGWRPADPSFDQQGRRYQPPPGLNCPIDLGYGLWGSCENWR